MAVAVWAKWYAATMTSPGAAKISTGVDLSVGGCLQNSSTMHCVASEEDKDDADDDEEEEEEEEEDADEAAANRAANSCCISKCDPGQTFRFPLPGREQSDRTTPINRENRPRLALFMPSMCQRVPPA